MTKLLTGGSCLTFQSSLAMKFGLNESIILQQLHYWITSSKKKSEEGRVWIYNTYLQWQKQFPFWSEVTIRRIFKSLEEQNIIIAKTANQRNLSVKFYTINYQNLQNLGYKLSALHNDKNTDQSDYNNNLIDHISCSKRTDRVINLISPIYIEETKNTTKEYLSKNTYQESFIKEEEKRENEFLFEKLDLVDLVQNTSSDSLLEVADKNHISGSKQVEETIATKENFSNKTFSSNIQDTAQSMLDIWNEIFLGEGREKSVLTFDRSKKLTDAYHHFNSDLTKFKNYLIKISSSKFLMGEVTNFRASLDWSIKLDVIIKIEEGSYKTGDRIAKTYVNNSSLSADYPKIQEEGDGSTQNKKANLKSSDPIWVCVLEQFRKTYGDATTRSWIEKLDFNKVSSTKVIISSPSSFIVNWIEMHYLRQIKSIITKVSEGEIDRVTLEHKSQELILHENLTHDNSQIIAA